MCMPRHVHGYQKKTFLHWSSPPSSLRQGLPCCLLASERFSCLLDSSSQCKSAGIADMSNHICLLGVLGIELRLSCFLRDFCPLSHLPSLSFLLLTKACSQGNDFQEWQTWSWRITLSHLDEHKLRGELGWHSAWVSFLAPHSYYFICHPVCQDGPNSQEIWETFKRLSMPPYPGQIKGKHFRRNQGESLQSCMW